MDYRLNLGAWRKIFAVPLCVAEDHLKIASGTQLKVLLYMLAYPDLGHRAENIAGAIGISKEDVDDALLYWVSSDVLACDGKEYFPSENAAAVSSAPTPAPAAPVTSPAPPEAPSLNTPEAMALLHSQTHFPAEIIAGAIKGDNAVKALFDMYQSLSGRLPKHSEQETLMILVEEIGLPCEVTMMLVEYCFNIDRATPAYMKSVAADWVENGITDIHKAEEHIRKLRAAHTTEMNLRRRFGMNTAFSSKQRGMIDEWTNIGLSEELIGAAYDECIENTSKLSFAYMDKILRSWLDKGITDPAQLADMPKPSSGGGKGESSSPSYNIDEIMKIAKSKYKK